MYKTLWRETLLLWMFSLIRLPMVFWLKPRIVEISENRAVIMMRFNRRTRNHVNSMYFGVLCVGAELAGGTLAMNIFHGQKEKFTFVFKDFGADFLKRCEGDTFFACDEGRIIADTVALARQTGERQNVTLSVIATVPSKYGDEPVGKFRLTLSLKRKP
ncbi:hypothetical protein AQUSIP_01980 [Aquicella siphonis]|uniref:DUF4442 domain-containing protein n=1 Tax=Aquicella siphonis TaxID=254247 RepID=A0A5E4PDQ8_9COXI|nr:DUF4442 domain-containing protein [Aquicella siphonis]VVC74924.1 hypothetical protein AQUSIP_01980 [Aquicella siphonis]